MYNTDIRLTTDAINKINVIIGRAYAMGIAGLNGDSRFDHFMDMELAYRHFGTAMNLDRLIFCDDLSFAHDFIGIRNHIDRSTCSYINDYFLPRCCCCI